MSRKRLFSSSLHRAPRMLHSVWLACKILPSVLGGRHFIYIVCSNCDGGGLSRPWLLCRGQVCSGRVIRTPSIFIMIPTVTYAFSSFSTIWIYRWCSRATRRGATVSCHPRLTSLWSRLSASEFFCFTHASLATYVQHWFLNLIYDLNPSTHPFYHSMMICSLYKELLHKGHLYRLDPMILTGC